MVTKNIYEDNLLWDDFLSGNEKAYGMIYEKYSKKLYIYGLQLTSDRQLIEDCIHDAFVNIYKSGTSLEPMNDLRIYLFTALRNNIIAAIKKQQRLLTEIFDEDEYDQIQDSNNIEEDFIDKEDEANIHTLVTQALHMLTIRQREVIHYRFYENMCIDDICVLMGINNQSAKNLLQKTLKKINHFIKNKAG